MPFEESFLRENIPYEISLRKSIKDIPVLYWFIKLLKASINEYDKFSIMSVLSNDYYGLNLSKEEYLKLTKENFKNSNISLVEKILSFNITSRLCQIFFYNRLKYLDRL